MNKAELYKEVRRKTLIMLARATKKELAISNKYLKDMGIK